MHYHNISIQICPDDPVQVERQSCSDNNNWFHIREIPVGYGILIDGATVEEVDAIVAAINVPIMRRRAELAAQLEHLREFDKHEPILFEPGVYHVRRQREYTPEGFRRVED